MTTHHYVTFELYLNVQTVKLLANAGRPLTGTGC